MEKKRCATCKELRPLSEFNKHHKRKDGLQTNCRICNRARSRQYYHENREKHLKVVYARKRKTVRANYKEVHDYFLKHPCVDCGEKDPLVLEFDHVRGKKRKCVCHLIIEGYSLKVIFSEIKKCEVRCANCHKRKTAKTFKFFKCSL